MKDTIILTLIFWLVWTILFFPRKAEVIWYDLKAVSKEGDVLNTYWETPDRNKQKSINFKLYEIERMCEEAEIASKSGQIIN